jgi:hypothetical protein
MTAGDGGTSPGDRYEGDESVGGPEEEEREIVAILTKTKYHALVKAFVVATMVFLCLPCHAIVTSHMLFEIIV